jgi:serine protease
MDRVSGETSREMLFSFGPGEQTASVFRTLDLQPRSQTHSLSTTISEAFKHKIDTLEVIKTLKRRLDIHDAAPNLIRQPFMVPNDNFYGLQWHYDRIGLPEAWDVTTGNGDVVVAVVDTGILSNHPDLATRLTADGYDFISVESFEGNEAAGEKGGIDPNPEDPGDTATGGSSFHGTHVAGTIAAATNNAIGVAGVGWDAARIMPLRALGVGGGTSYDIIQAVRYAAGLTNDSGTFPVNPADIINLSLGGGGFSTVEQDLYKTISESGVIVVAASGNESTNQKTYPAAYDGVISVSAVDFSSNLAYYSNFGETIDLAAPGGDNSADLNADGYPDGVLSTTGDDTSGVITMAYSFNQGTSMAVPHVAGVVALMKAVWPKMSYHAFDSLLRSGIITNDLGTLGWDDFFGYGLIDAQKAVIAAQGGTLPTALSVSPSTISFGTAFSSSTLRLTKLGDVDATLSVTSISDDSDWLNVIPDQIDGDGLGTYTVEVDRTGLAGGFYGGVIAFVSSENTVNVPVGMLVSPVGRSVDAGYHYVLLLDPATYETLEQVDATLDDGVYRFSFSNVGEGDYLLYAGTDLDNDSVIGDRGNALGAYPSIDQPTVIHPDKNLGGLDFRTEFNINLFDLRLINHDDQNLPIQRIRKKIINE